MRTGELPLLTTDGGQVMIFGVTYMGDNRAGMVIVTGVVYDTMAVL